MKANCLLPKYHIQISTMEALEERMFLSAVSRLASPPNALFNPANSLLVGASAKTGTTQTTTDDYGNTFAAAKAISLDSLGVGSLSGTINYSSDVDMLSFLATQTGSMQINLTPTANRRNNASGDLSAYDSATTLILRDANGANITATVTFDVVSGQKYYVKVAALSGTGAYAVSIATTAAPLPPPPDPTPPPPDPTPPPPTPGNYVPGTVVSWLTETSGSGTGLVVLGTDGTDAITVSKVSGNTVIYVSGVLAWTTSQVFSSIALYGFAGDDTLVSISGAAETVWGGTGFDSFWADSKDTLADVEAAETAAKSVHVVTQFYQPTTDPTKAVTLELAGQNIVDPSDGGLYANFSAKPLFANGPQYSDAIQGSVGDCYFIAALASLTNSDAGVIRQMIAPMGDGTYAVRFFRNGLEYYVRADAQLPVSGTGALVYAGLSCDGETWVALAEKAYAQFRTGANTYASLANGSTDVVYKEVTNVGTAWVSSSLSPDSVASFISDNLQAGHALSAGSFVGATFPIVGSHAYAVQSVQNVDGQWYVTVYNPWGTDGTGFNAWDSNPYDGLLTLSMPLFQQSFGYVLASLA